MSNKAGDSTALMRKIINDIRVQIADEFDRNFERQAFFAEAWKRRKSPLRGDKHILVDTGDIRRSIKAESDENSVTFSSSLPYAAIHNEGGEITVTAKMKRYFWYRYYEAQGGFKRRKDGSLSRSKKQIKLSTEAEFWRALALMKVGSTIKIPQRRFLGTSPELEKQVTDILEKDVSEYLEKLTEIINK